MDHQPFAFDGTNQVDYQSGITQQFLHTDTDSHTDTDVLDGHFTEKAKSCKAHHVAYKILNNMAEVDFGRLNKTQESKSTNTSKKR